MKTEKELSFDIQKITLTIEVLYPQLSKYLGEIPVPPAGLRVPESNVKNLTDYYNSLDVFLNYYTRYQLSIKN
jgi:hypothetical protein